MRRSVAGVVGLVTGLLMAPTLSACPVCFQIEEGPASAGVRAAVVVLLAVTGTVLAGAGLFVVRFVRRSAQGEVLE